MLFQSAHNSHQSCTTCPTTVKWPSCAKYLCLLGTFACRSLLPMSIMLLPSLGKWLCFPNTLSLYRELDEGREGVEVVAHNSGLAHDMQNSYSAKHVIPISRFMYRYTMYMWFPIHTQWGPISISGSGCKCPRLALRCSEECCKLHHWGLRQRLWSFTSQWRRSCMLLHYLIKIWIGTDRNWYTCNY